MNNKIEVPDFATHYYHPNDAPFKNLSDLGQAELTDVLENLKCRRKAEPANIRVFGPVYMQFRAETEAKMRALFMERGEGPERAHPHYFALGECDWFAGLYPANHEVRIRLEGLNPKVVSFTYPDSFVAMRLGGKYGLPAEPLEPYHNRVFLLSELKSMACQMAMTTAMTTITNGNSRSISKFRFGATIQCRSF